MPANAASLYWDGASSGPDADGGLGTWSTAASPANWDSAATAGSDVPWTDGSEAVFGGTDYTASAFAAFAQSADDARAVVNYIHEYAIPADTPPSED